MKKALIYTFLLIILVIGVLAVNLVLFNKNASVISEGTPIPEYGTTNSALLVLDIQEGTTGSVSVTKSYISQSEWLIPRINQLAQKADSLQIPVVYIRSEVSNPLINILNNTMAAGSEGANLDHRLNVASNHIITKKKNDSFNDTELDQLLTEMKVNHIILTGLDAGHCVYSAFLGALNRGYEITVVEDAVISDPEEQKSEILKQFTEQGARLIQSSEFARSILSE